ncbi:MAG: putative membrane protein [Chlamydiales bacterium]|jgi:uncharacterized membrane protein
MPAPGTSSGNLWMVFAFMTVASWGLYGIFLHMGQEGMNDPVNGRYKAFFMVGIAYVAIAVLAPAGFIVAKGGDWSMPSAGWTWSLVAGTVGAIGAFCVLLAFGAGGKPAVVMSIIFAGAPIVNACVAIAMHPPAGGISTLRWQFYAGIALAATGGTLVTLYKPKPPAKGPAAVHAPMDAPAEALK